MVLFILLRFQYPLFTYLYICWIASSSFSEDFVPLDLVKLSRTDCDHNIKLNLKYINKLTIKTFESFILLFNGSGLHPPVPACGRKIPVGSCRKQVSHMLMQPSILISSCRNGGLASFCCSLLRNTSGRF